VNSTFVTDSKFRFVLYSKGSPVKDIRTSFITQYQLSVGMLLYTQRRSIWPNCCENFFSFFLHNSPFYEHLF